MATKKTKAKATVTRPQAVADVQRAIEACRKTAPKAACMSGVLLDDYANDLVRVAGLIAVARHDDNVTNLDTASLDVALGTLNEIRVALVFAHRALVDAGVVEAKG